MTNHILKIVLALCLGTTAVEPAYALFDGPQGFSCRPEGQFIFQTNGISIKGSVKSINTASMAMRASARTTQTAGTANALMTSQGVSYLDFDNYELATNAVLDKLCADFNYDALALYQYVLNEVDFRRRATPNSIAMSYSMKGALGCYLEREGNDVDLCALTIYLLRRCGVSCIYIYPNYSLDTWIQLNTEQALNVFGVETPASTSNVLFGVWADLDNVGVDNISYWHALFPWFKTRTINYQNGIAFRDVLSNSTWRCGRDIVDSYLRRDGSLESVITNSSDLATEFLPELFRQVLATNASSVSLDQLGMEHRLSEEYYDTWNEFTTVYENLFNGASLSGLVTLPSEGRSSITFKLTNSVGAVLISTNFSTVELHNRRVLAYFDPATANDITYMTNHGGYYAAGPNYDLRAMLHLGATQTQPELTVTGSANYVRLNTPVTMCVDNGSRSLSAGNYECYVFDFGRVTQEMMDFHHNELSKASALTKTNTNLQWTDSGARMIIGEQLCAVGFNYYLLADRIMRQIADWTQVRSEGVNHVGSFFFDLSSVAGGLYLSDTMRMDAFGMNVDYDYVRNISDTNSLRVIEPNAQERDFFSLFAMSLSTLEHGIIQKVYGVDEAMSADKCLRTAVAGGGSVILLATNNYKTYQSLINSVDSTAWGSITQFFAGSPQGQVWFPSRLVTNASWHGSGWVKLDLNTNSTVWSAGYLIAGSNHGGISQPITGTEVFNDIRGNRINTSPDYFSVGGSSDGGITIRMGGGNSGALNSDAIGTCLSNPGLGGGLGNVSGTAVSGWQQNYGQTMVDAQAFFGSGATPANNNVIQGVQAQTLATMGDAGYLQPIIGQRDRSWFDDVADPVDTRTGGFYVDETDLVVPGIMPVVFRRAYSSQYGAVGDFGYGWRFNHNSFIAVGTNATELRAVEPDGTVLAYIATNGFWRPTADANPFLANQNRSGMGGTANPFNNIIQLSGNNYLLYAADGSVRTYSNMTFSADGTDRSRPWLVNWQDANGNAITYIYGQTPGQNDYGRIAQVNNATHGLRLNYNYAGFLSEVRCDDGQILQYEYSDSGDLVTVYRPDNTVVQYDYQTLPVPWRHSAKLYNLHDYVQVADSAALRLTTAVSIEAWVKLDANPTGWSRIVGKGDANHRSYGLWQANNTNLLFQFKTTTAFYNLYAPPNIGVIPSAGWHHVAGTWDGVTAKLYLDGQIVASTNTVGSSLVTSADTLTMGYDLDPNNGSVVGQVDDVLIWSIARTDSQILADMNNGVGGPATNLVGAWTFNDGQATDISVNLNNGQFCNTARSSVDPNTFSTHLIVRETKPGGRVLENSYDALRRVTEQRATVGLAATAVRNATFTYSGDGTNGATQVANILGAITRYDYTNGIVWRVTDALGHMETNQWDAARNLITHADKRGVLTHNAFDSAGNLIVQQVVGDITGNGVVSTATTLRYYTTNSVMPLTTNLLASVSDPRGAITKYYYDSHNNLVTQEICNANGDLYRRDIFAHDSVGLLRSKTEALGAADAATTAYDYDTDGNLIETSFEPGFGQGPITHQFQNNLRGWVTRATDATGTGTDYDYDAMGRVTTLTKSSLIESRTYDDNGNLIAVKGPRTEAGLDDSVIRTYDRMNHLLSQTTKRHTVTWNGSVPQYSSSGIATTTYGYDALGNLLSETDPKGNVTRHIYDAEGHRTSSSVYENGTKLLASSQFGYDAGGLLVSNRTPQGFWETTEYTALGRPKRTVHADGAEEQWRYDLGGAMTTNIDPRNIMTQFQLDDFGRTTNRVEALGKPLQRSYSFSYDQHSRLTSVTDPQRLTTTSTLDAAGRPVIITGPSGASQTIIRNWYDGESHLLSSAIDGVSTTTNLYNNLGQLTHKEWYKPGSAADSFENYAYDEAGHQTQVVRGNLETDRVFYDERGLPGIKVLADGHSRSLTYDANGNLNTYCDELGGITSFTYDGLNHPLVTTLPDGQTVNRQFDPDGNCTLASYPFGIRHLRGFNSVGRVITERVLGSSGGTLLNNTFNYDAAGNLVTKTTARGVSLNSSYDDLGRRTALSASAYSKLIPAVSISWNYSPNSWLNNAACGMNSLGFGLDQAGRILSETNTIAGSQFEVRQSFDAAGQRITGIVTGMENWGSSWDGAGRLSTMTWAGNTFSYAFDAAGRLQTIGGGPAANLINTWNSRYCLAARRYYSGGTDFLYESTSSNRPNLQRLNIVGQGFYTNGFSYDLLGQLIGETNYCGANSYTNSYAYDALNVRTQYTKLAAVSLRRDAILDQFHCLIRESTTNAAGNPVITVQGQIFSGSTVRVYLNGADKGAALVNTNTQAWIFTNLTLTSGTNLITATNLSANAGDTVKVTVNLNGRGSYAYDAEGNLLWMNRDNKSYTLTWNAIGQLSGVAVRDGAGNGQDWTAAYDALGRRVQTMTQNISGTGSVGVAETVCSVFDPYCPLAEVLRVSSVSGTNFFLYGSDNSGQLYGIGGIGGLLASRQTGTVFQAVNDLRGNVVGLINTGGIGTNNPRYGAFGPLSAPTLNVPSFSTRWRDPTGFYYFGGRYYDAAVGRFLSPDPARFADSRNLYAYCGNDPVNGLDPDGMLQTGSTREYKQATLLPRTAELDKIDAQLARETRKQNTRGGRLWELEFGRDPDVQLDAAMDLILSVVLMAVDIPEVGVIGEFRAAGSMASMGKAVDSSLAMANLARDFKSTSSALGTEVRFASGAAKNIANAGTSLSESELVNFTARQAKQTVLTEADVLYRMHPQGGAGGPYWTRTPPTSELQHRMDTAWRIDFGAADQISTLRIPRGQGLNAWEGSAAYQGDFYFCGGNQLFIPHIPQNWISTQPLR